MLCLWLLDLTFYLHNTAAENIWNRFFFSVFVFNVVRHWAWLGFQQHLALALFSEYIREMQVWGNCGWDFDLLGLPAFPCLRATAASRDLVWYVVSVSSYGKWSKQFLQSLSYQGVLMICLPVASLPKCVWYNKNAAHLSDRRLCWKLFLKNVSICISAVSLCVFASQKDTEVLSEALHEMKEENRLLKQKNASMTRKKEHYESEISRLNKVGTRVSCWLLWFWDLSCQWPTRYHLVNPGSWENKQELTSAQTCAYCSWQIVGLHIQRRIQRVFGFSYKTSLYVMSKPFFHPPSEQKGKGTKVLLYALSERLWLKRKVTQLKNSCFICVLCLRIMAPLHKSWSCPPV